MSDVIGSSFALKRQSLIDQAKRVDATLTQLTKSQSTDRDLSKKVQAAEEDFRKAYSAVLKDTSAVCHEILLARSRDEWSLSFSYLANYFVSQLGRAHLAKDASAESAMMLNLSRIAEAMLSAFPDRRMVIEPWRRSIQSLGEPLEPTLSNRPHPHVDSLSQVLCTLRDTGPNLPLRELFAYGESDIHVVRPA